MIEKLQYPQVVLFFLALLVAFAITPYIIRLSHKVGALDHPKGYKAHREPVSFLGGIVIFIAFSVSLFSILRFENFAQYKNLFAIMFGGFILVIVGCLDDYRPMNAIIKLFILLFVTFVLSRFNVMVSIFSMTELNIVLTLLWIAGVTSALNSFDNMDGASLGISAIASFYTFYIAWYDYQRGVSFLAVAILGACIGLLRYNFKPARIFMGDNGAFLLGFLLASLMVLTGWSKKDPYKAFIIPCAILSVPLYDITLSTVLRYKNKVVNSFAEAILYCGRDHLSHRLVALGFSEREAVLLMYLFATISGAVGVFISFDWVTAEIYIPTVLLSLIMLMLLGAFLDRARVYQK